MSKYYSTNNLILKIDEPVGKIDRYFNGNRDYTSSDEVTPRLLVFVKPSEMAEWDEILHELTANYIHNEKMYVYLINIEKNPFLFGSDGRTSDAIILYRTRGRDLFEDPNGLTEYFSSYARKAEMTKERFKNWLNAVIAQMERSIERNGLPEKSEYYSIEYFVAKNEKGEYKILPHYIALPDGWSDVGVGLRDKETSLRYAEELEAEELDR